VAAWSNLCRRRIARFELALILLKVEDGCRRRRHAIENRGDPMNERTAYSTCLLYFLAGGVAGVSVGLLLAPKSGKVTREAMRSKLRETADSARDLKDRVVRQGEQVREEATRRVGAAASALAGSGTDDVSA